jgi:hypothetical protein
MAVGADACAHVRAHAARTPAFHALLVLLNRGDPTLPRFTSHRDRASVRPCIADAQHHRCLAICGICSVGPRRHRRAELRL